MYDKGADVIYHAAGGSGAGVFEAAKANKKMAIGVDSDRAKTAEKDVQGRHHHLDGQERECRGLRLHQGLRRRRADVRSARVRPQGRRRQLHDDRRQDRRHHGSARRLQAADHRREDHRSREVTLTGSSGPDHTRRV
ncbi:BMP family ABC transporter substrate-binding protein [Janibacter limosus]|uniref:BMP family ABC transporter substrate-binding protein n=1 Tax=Janibacter limosus TaxID=53458 RepID=A0AC61U8J9_9MICO|nr:BMP family ABC transporter substrate-binding protein [Janibacter limosus]UUZ46382.1 BMP family ABC transporter substrate-binding protein [Janibacter limosus]